MKNTPQQNYWQQFCTYLIICVIFIGHMSCAVPARAFLGFGDFGIAEEKEMGRKFSVLIRSQLPLVEDPEVSLYVRGLVNKLAKHIPPQPFEFTSGVILHNALNAFAVPGGHVFVFSGLIMQLDNEAQLAGVIAHELAHVTQRHVASRIERGQYLSIATLLLAIAGVIAGGDGGAALAAGALGAGQSAMLNYSRIDETEADNVGYQYLIAAGYPPMGMAGGFQKIREKSSMSGSNIPTYLSTHPDIGTRITNIMARAQSGSQALNKRTVDNRQFLRVKTLLWARYGSIQMARHFFTTTPTSDGLAQMGLAMLLSRENKVQEANVAFDIAVKKAPHDPLVLREAGIFHYRKGDMAQAEALLQGAMRLDPRDYMAQFFLARIFDDTKRTQEAAVQFKNVLRALPQDKEVHAAYARSLGHDGQHFLAYLHLAYSALYGNEKRKVKQYFDKAKGLAQTPTDKAKIASFTEQFKERKAIWDEGM